MNPAPLPQPAPFTCPNCGAGIESKSELCPRCGARLEGETKRSLLSIVALVGLSLGLLVFGAIGACGAYFTVELYPDRNRDLNGVILFGAACCLLVGLIGCGLCLLPFFRRKR